MIVAATTFFANVAMAANANDLGTGATNITGKDVQVSEKKADSVKQFFTGFKMHNELAKSAK
ncbi:MAG: hypothetical protein D6698_07900 [Gammaproteobacteria bacterium]|nr:MAG: hypothetical protein D6698_07900 [Gammaproteobacteria bacterium]